MTNIVALSALIILLLMFLKMPVFLALFSGTIVYFLANSTTSLQMIAQRAIAGMESTPLLAIPFFVAAGIYMNYSGVTRRIMDFCSVLTGRMWGGLAQVNVLLSTLMGGLSGSNIADAAMEAKMLVPEMEKKGFSKPFSTVVTATSAMITPLIPPGIGMIVYGSIAGVSIGKLFIAGIGPGLLLCISMMILVRFVSKSRGYKRLREDKISPSEKWEAFKPAFFPLLLPVVILGGIRIGIFTPTEAGSVAVAYALILGLIYRELNLKSILEGLAETVLTTAGIMLIVGAASAFAWVLTKERIPQTLTAFMVSHIHNKYVFLLVVNVFLLIVGMFIEGNAALIVLVPLLHPIALQYGIDEIQFAMVFIFNITLGAVTPPMGMLMFVTCGITGCEIRDFLKESIPFYIMLFICLMLLTFFPAFTTGLVNLFW
ncbi:MAG: TRAP transporter large permease [Stomatobaculum sp.]|nr:TRAP transporter large permease [Stomatobaculum sp.]